MVTYTIHEAANSSSDRIDRATELRFLKDGFNWLTAICPPLGFIADRLWLPLVIYFIGTTVVAVLFIVIGIPSAWTSLIFFMLNIYLGLEHASIARWDMERHAYTDLGSVTGKDRTDCERRFFESWLPEQPILRTPPPPSTTRNNTPGAGSAQWTAV